MDVLGSEGGGGFNPSLPTKLADRVGMTDEIPVARRRSAVGTTKPKPWTSVQQLVLGHRWQWSGLVAIGVALVLGLVLVISPGSPPVDPVVTQPEPSPTVQPSPEATGSRLSVLGHFAHEEAPAETLEAVGTYHGRGIQLRGSAAQAYREMTAAALAAGIQVVPISGFRSIADQEYLFFQRAQNQAQRPQQRAEVSAPPGYSEHHTGYAIDVGDASMPQTDIEVSFEQTPAFGWLQTNAARFGFELSFPRDNAQGISYEPWHWRYVGDRHSLETFYQAQE